ncbi:MAG: hypothetical protein N2170_02720 [Bacteroidia bacterium]|nr:hypothetical protein [Bacteroidia bacterium]
MQVTIWLLRDVVLHPRGYYRLARSLAKAFPVQVVGRPLPPVEIEGPLASEIASEVWEQLCSIPLSSSLSLTFSKRWLPPAPKGGVVICNPIGFLFAALYGVRPAVWDIWEDYRANFLHDPAYDFFQRLFRLASWEILSPWRGMAYAYGLAEYAYARLTPLHRSFFIPNAFVKVEDAPPLLPSLTGRYALYTGNLAEGWGLFEVLEQVLEQPMVPFVLAGSLKSASIERGIRSYLRRHPAWLWFRSAFVPYPVVQNLQRYAKFIYAMYKPLPHLRGKIPGKFYEAAALGVPCVYPTGVSPVWDAFWRRYREEPDAPELYWSFYEPYLLEGISRALERSKQRG